MRVCPSCGFTYSDERDTCPLCDVFLPAQDKTQVITVPQRIPSEFHRPCPYCGQRVLIGLDRCPWCRRPLEGERASEAPQEPSRPASALPESAAGEKPTVLIDPRLMSFETMDTEETRIIERRSLQDLSEEAPSPPAEAPGQEPPVEIFEAPTVTFPTPPSSPPEAPDPGLPFGIEISPTRFPAPPTPPAETPNQELPLQAPAAGFPVARIGWAVLGVIFLFGVGFSGYWFLRRGVRPDRPVRPSSSPQTVAPPPQTESPRSTPSDASVPPAMGRLIVNVPFPAQIYVDDALVDTAPGAEIPVSPGVHRVRVVWLPRDKTPPPAPQEFTIEVSPGQAVTLPVTPPMPARLYVNSWPWSEVWVDGQRHGETPTVMTLPAGPHELEFRRPDGRSYRVPVELPADGVLRVGYDFTSGQLWQNPPPSAPSGPGVDRRRGSE